MRIYQFVASFTLLLGLWSAQSRAAVMVLGAGLAETCWRAAYAVSRNDIYPIPELDMRPIDICSDALAAHSLNARDTAGTFVNRGVLLFAEGRYERALADFDAAIAAADVFAESHANRGAALVALHRWADSIAAIDKGLAGNALEPEKSYYNRAIANEELGHVREAYLDYQKASELRPAWKLPKDQLTRFKVVR